MVFNATALNIHSLADQ